MYNTLSLRTLAFAVLALAAIPGSAAADGKEFLGPPVRLEVAEGSDILVAGVGMENVAVGIVNLEVPTNATIKQVIAYWEGQEIGKSAHGWNDTIIVGGKPVTGNRIGGPTRFFLDVWSSAYRADITELGIVKNGPNAITVSGFDFGYVNQGFGLVVIIDDGTGLSDIDIRDGNDLAFIHFRSPLDTTVPITYEFEASDKPRPAQLGFHVASVAEGRPSVIEIKIDGNTFATLPDVLGDTDGPVWDSLAWEFVIPAGATSVTVQLRSEDSGSGQYKGNLPASLAWVHSSLVIHPPESEPEGGCSAEFWYKNKDAWPAGFVAKGKDKTKLDVFGLSKGFPFWDKSLYKKSLHSALKHGRKSKKSKSSKSKKHKKDKHCSKGKKQLGELTKYLMQEAAAALLNAASTKVNFPLTVAEVKAETLAVLTTVHNDPSMCLLLQTLGDRFAAMNDAVCDLGSSEKCQGGIVELGLVTELTGFGSFPVLVTAIASDSKKDTGGKTMVSYDPSNPPSLPVTDDGVVFIESISVVGNKLVVGMRVDASGSEKGKLSANTDFLVSANSAVNQRQIHTSCSQPIGVGFEFPPFTINLLVPRGDKK